LFSDDDGIVESLYKFAGCVNSGRFINASSPNQAVGGTEDVVGWSAV
jgi:hypothetical protein